MYAGGVRSTRRQVPARVGGPLVGAAAALLPVGQGQAQVPGAGRITRGPYLQLATASGVTVLWRSEAPASSAGIEYRPAGQSGASWEPVASPSRQTQHAVTLTGLRPQTTYEYRVRLDGGPAVESFTFRTLPSPTAEDLDFIHVADNQTGHAPHAQIVRRILAEVRPPALIIHAGDQCENGLRVEQWDQWFQIERDLLAHVPVFPCLGNHEENSPLFFEHFRFPSNGSGQGHGRWYSYDAGPAHFVALDVVFSDTEPGSAQYRWLEQDLARTDRKWKFVYFHYPPYNASPHHRSNFPLREALEPVFLRHKVSAVFNGHGHLYERAYGAKATDGPPLVWFVSGGGGGVPQPAGDEDWTQYTEVTFHFLRVQLRGDRMSITGVRPDSTEFDHFEARLNADGRVAPVTVSRAVAGRAVVRQPGAMDFLRSPRGAMMAGYQAAVSLVAPLGLSVSLPSRRRRVIPVPSGAEYRPLPRPEDPHADWRGLPVVGIAVGVITLLLLALLPTAPLRWLVGFNAYTVTLGVHAAVATIMLLAACTGAAMGYRLASHRSPSLWWIFGSVATSAVLAAVSVVLGDVLYAQYIKSGGPMEEVVRKASGAHTIFFEFKVRVGLLPLPLSAAAAFIAWRYKGDLRRDRHLAELMALLLLLLVFFVLVPFVLGASVTRLRGIL